MSAAEPIRAVGLPSFVRALTTTRAMEGASIGPHARFNLGGRCGDVAEAVARNRDALADALGLPSRPAWLEQVHGRTVHVVDHDPAGEVRADVAVTFDRGRVLAVLTADCLPVVLASDGGALGVVHAGWRGLVLGAIDAGVDALEAPASSISAWIGPAIRAESYEVGADVRDGFVSSDAGAAAAFAPTCPGHWRCDLAALARRALERRGVERVVDSALCTYADAARFYSFRRDGVTGRQATLAWLDR